MDASQPRNPWPLAGGLAAAAVFTLLGGILFIAMYLRPEPVPAPATFASFSAKDGSFACDYPSDWRKDYGEAQGISSMASFERGAAEIYIVSDLSGSLIGDIARSSNSMIESIPGVPSGAMEKQRAPVEVVHETNKGLVEEKMDLRRIAGYEETPPKPFKSQLGEGRFSEFTGQGNFVLGKVRGYRATVLGGERAITVITYCPESEWSKLKPAFERVIGSIGQGTGG